MRSAVVQRLIEDRSWGSADQSLTWADSMVWGQRCDGDCVNGRGRSTLADGETYQGSFKVLESTIDHLRTSHGCSYVDFIRLHRGSWPGNRMASDMVADCASGLTIPRTMVNTTMV